MLTSRLACLDFAGRFTDSILQHKQHAKHHWMIKSRTIPPGRGAKANFSRIAASPPAPAQPGERAGARLLHHHRRRHRQSPPRRERDAARPAPEDDAEVRRSAERGGELNLHGLVALLRTTSHLAWLRAGAMKRAARHMNQSPIRTAEFKNKTTKPSAARR